MNRSKGRTTGRTFKLPAKPYTELTPKGKKARMIQLAQHAEGAKAEPARVEENKGKSIITRNVEMEPPLMPVPFELEEPKWIEEVGLPKDLSTRQEEVISKPTEDSWISWVASNSVNLMGQTYSIFAPPTVEILLKIAFSFGGANSASPAEVEAYNQEIAKMSNRITSNVAMGATNIVNRMASNLTNLVFNPVSTLTTKAVTKATTEPHENMLLIYKNAYFF